MAAKKKLTKGKKIEKKKPLIALTPNPFPGHR